MKDLHHKTEVDLGPLLNFDHSVTCLMRNNPDDLTPQELIVTVTGLNGSQQSGTGDVTFGYKVQ